MQLWLSVTASHGGGVGWGGEHALKELQMWGAVEAYCGSAGQEIGKHFVCV